MGERDRKRQKEAESRRKRKGKRDLETKNLPIFFLPAASDMLSYTKLSNMGPTIIKVFFSTFQTAILFPRWPIDVAARIFQ